MKDETGKKKSDPENRIRNVTLWRCTNCGGLNRTEEQPEVCELCGEEKHSKK